MNNEKCKKIKNSILDSTHSDFKHNPVLIDIPRDNWLAGYVIGENNTISIFHGWVGKALMALGGDFNHNSVAKAKKILREALDTRFPPLQ